VALLEHQEILPRQEFMRLDERIAGRVEFLRPLFPAECGRTTQRIRFEIDDGEPSLGPWVLLVNFHLERLYFNALGHSLSSQTGSKIAYSWPM